MIQNIVQKGRQHNLELKSIPVQNKKQTLGIRYGKDSMAIQIVRPEGIDIIQNSPRREPQHNLEWKSIQAMNNHKTLDFR
jgi:hypothetical protein